MAARLGCIEDVPDPRDLIYETRAPEPIPARVDLRDHLPPCYQQGDLNSCTSNAIAAALEFLQGRHGGPPVMPSRLFIYYNERVLEGKVGQDQGAQLRNGIKTVVKQGCCPENDWPYDPSQVLVKPPPACYDRAQRELLTRYMRLTHSLDSMLQCLASGFPFVFGMNAYDSFMDPIGGSVPMPGPRERIQGRHAMLAVGYDLASRRFSFRNSWGPTWGDGTGHGTIPFEYLSDLKLARDYWTLRQETRPIPDPEASHPRGRIIGISS